MDTKRKPKLSLFSANWRDAVTPGDRYKKRMIHILVALT
jgi:hypothetical protein